MGELQGNNNIHNEYCNKIELVDVIAIATSLKEIGDFG